MTGAKNILKTVEKSKKVTKELTAKTVEKKTKKTKPTLPPATSDEIKDFEDEYT